MNTRVLAQKVQAATPEERKLIGRMLTAPVAVKHSLQAALAGLLQPSARSQFLREVVETALTASKEVNVAVALEGQLQGLEALVAVLTQPEALRALAPTDPLVAARLKGVQVKWELLYGDTQPLTSEEVGQLLHITRQAVDKRRSKGQLLAVSLGRRGYHYPTWQFQDSKVLPGLERVLAVLQDYDAWTQLMFLKTGDLRLGGATPLERLQAGDIDTVVWAAQSYGQPGAA